MKKSPDVDPPAPPSPADAGPAPAAAPPAAAPAAREGPESELAAAKALVATLEDRIRRQQAEFVNDTRRIQRQADERAKYAVQPVVSDLLGVVDALHSAIEGLKEGEHERRVADGLRLIEKELLEVLGRHGVAKIDAIGKPFDPAVHEAMLEIEHEGPARTVLQVMRQGFTLHGRVVRAAHVIVSRKKDGDAASVPAAGSDAAGPSVGGA